MLSPILLCLLLVLSFSWPDRAIAGRLADRLADFPHWQSKPPVTPARGDLAYPSWMAGTWRVNSPLIDAIAPFAPEIVTPGFAQNQSLLHHPIRFRVRFQKTFPLSSRFPLGFPQLSALVQDFFPIVADRQFNGWEIARAYLGEGQILSVTVDPRDPNRQLTQLQGDRQLISLVTGRAREIPSPTEFVATELVQQIFRSPEGIYLNEVETTTDYHLLESGNIDAEQVTAIYLSPQDPDYFSTFGRPVALYRYHLQLDKCKDATCSVLTQKQ
ncbi:MAG: hypothetical protein J7647_21365 [Cyanobacteria bacterium SBLK]|nr:hypothetical protein [Cyanobacteria bacterium SBLK]